MKKKLLIALLAMASAVCCAFGFTACDGGSGNGGGNGGDKTEHSTHVYDQKVSQDKYLKSEADCTHKAVYYYSCECGEKGTETFEYGEANGHNYEDGVCLDCGRLKPTDGLGYTLSDDRGYYYVSSIGTATESDIVIAAKYNGLPVTSIGERAFEDCKSLESIIIPDSVISIGSEAFYGCSSLESITVADGNTKYHSAGNCLIETVSKELILGCKNSVIPDDGSVTIIGENAFAGCSGLTSITIPARVTAIGEWAFSGCSSLESITIPDSVTSIGEWAFEKCSSLAGITIPDSVTSIGSSAFFGCSSLTSITIPDSVTSIGVRAFYNCSSLTSITIPDSVTLIGNDAFFACRSLTSITFKGTKEQWNAVKKGSYWNSNTGNYTVHCKDGDISK